MIARLVGLVLSLGIMLPALAAAACLLNDRTSVPLEVADNAIIVPVEINGLAARFILDTGAERSVVSEPAVRRLELARDEWIGTTMHGLGGIESRPNADPRSLTLGGVPLVRRTLNHDTSLTVGVLPHAVVGDRVIDGLLGRDFLSLFDLDLDLPGHRLTLYQPHGCEARFLPWRSGYTAVSARFLAGGAVVVPVTLDGTPLNALLDTGAGGSLVAAPGLFRLGLRQASLAHDPTDQVGGLGPRLVTMHRHRFRTLEAGGQEIDQPIIWVAAVRLRPIADMLLGADWLRGRRLWISFTTHQVFVATP